jgi:hypothetical protein
MNPQLNQIVWIINKNNKIEEHVWKLGNNPHNWFWSYQEAKETLIRVELAIRNNLL